jgi:AraC family transcriptional regulator
MASSGEAPGIDPQEPRMEDKKTLLVAGLMKQFSPEKVNDIPLLWREVSSHFGKIPGQVDRKAYGVIYNMNDDAGFAYMAGVEVSTAADVPEELNVIRIPEVTCAVFEHIGSVSTLKDTVTRVWHEWLPASGLKVARGDEEMPDILEQYGEGFNPETGTGDIEVWVPIKNRSRTVTYDSEPEV